MSGEPVYHHSGPFDGVRLDYNVLRNPQRRADHYLRCIEEFARFGTAAHYRSRGTNLGMPPDVSKIRADINGIVRHWEKEGIAVGSDEALELDY